ncbi:hypothetical protein C7T35_28740 [Variovorax sp. WS11]|uniref:hypothetical protein n=1 Tax=Variovorax sp. WS11 TaxID=1105204 RepID=UPI000D0DF298|nr:hypothetical protein [Variovorax sp. WS11]NDZ13598.1 hypothetical protein [Variovorax sp. WS11]PSL81162.1 hypothetical protein C7T35_28740 [Variovorax sp. WS11]
MPSLSEMIADAEVLAQHALRQNVALPAGTADVLLAARRNQAAIAVPGAADRDAFYRAFGDAVAGLNTTPGDIRAQVSRVARMRPLADAAQRLLTFAAGNGRKVEDEIRKPLVLIGAAVDSGMPTAEQEQEFMKAYEGLTIALAPITEETLDASTTRLPTVVGLYKAKGLEKLQSWTLGRILSVLVFMGVLWGTCVALSFYFQGSFALNRYKELQEIVVKLTRDIPVMKAALQAAARPIAPGATGVATAAFNDKRAPRVGATPAAAPAATAGQGGTAATSLEAANKATSDATIAVTIASLELARAKEELATIPDRLASWAASSCLDSNPIAKLVLCSDVEKAKGDQAKARAERTPERVGPAPGRAAALPTTDVSTTPASHPGGGMAFAVLSTPGPSDAAKVEQARTVASRLSDVYLPLLLGWLGAHAFILRRMSKEITARTFAKGSGFNHLVRLGLGALAGLASTWLLTPESVSSLLSAQEAVVGGTTQAKKLPIWALAFVAGYGIELVFAFMDRIIAAFTAKDPNAPAT